MNITTREISLAEALEKYPQHFDVEEVDEQGNPTYGCFLPWPIGSDGPADDWLDFLPDELTEALDENGRLCGLDI